MLYAGMALGFLGGLLDVAVSVAALAGGLLGRRLGCLFQKRAELAGGLVLIGIGFKILGEHLG